MKIDRTYRTNGAIGTLLDEYEKAITELKFIIDNISKEQLIMIVDPDTEDDDCRSIQTILSHVVRSGYGYVVYIRRLQGEKLDFFSSILLNNTKAYRAALGQMFTYNVQLFEDYPALKIEENVIANKIMTNWGQLYDPEQLLEHAIVHILRHRRQIERFLLRM